MNTIGIVIIGRNEGARLQRCLKSLPAGIPKIYVDSDSSDGSVDLARAMEVQALAVDPSKPMSAARSRNEGFAALLAAHPGVHYVQFLDGDCTIEPGWLDAAAAALQEDPRRSAVVGHLIELHADATPYNRLCALEWKSPPGDLKDFGAFGGISMIRATVFRDLGGFRPEVIAGEDSEFGVRMGLAGYRVTKIDHVMATHDANITRFRQWWLRAVRAGHAIGQRSHLNGATAQRDCVRERNSTWLWGIGLPLVTVGAAPVSGGWSLLLLPLAYGWMVLRVVRFRRSRGDSMADAVLYARYLLLAKFANAWGLLKFHFNQQTQRFEIIEYK